MYFVEYTEIPYVSFTPHHGDDVNRATRPVIKSTVLPKAVIV
jgi:hypothetical protein